MDTFNQSGEPKKAWRRLWCFSLAALRISFGLPKLIFIVTFNGLRCRVDWVAMGFEFGDTARDYYEKNKEEIKLPEWAIKLMYEIFDCIYPA